MSARRATPEARARAKASRWRSSMIGPLLWGDASGHRLGIGSRGEQTCGAWNIRDAAPDHGHACKFGTWPLR